MSTDFRHPTAGFETSRQAVDSQLADQRGRAGAGQPVSESQLEVSPTLSLDQAEPAGKKITDIYACEDVINLFRYLHNDNDRYDFVMAFRCRGVNRYHRSKRLSFETAIIRSVDTISGTAESGHQMAYAPYPRNGAGQSRFGVMDFDAHDGNFMRARQLATAALNEAKKSDAQRYLILESSGAGYHLWIIKDKFYSCEEWSQLLLSVAAAIGAIIAPGICEIFPGPQTTS